MVTTSSTVPIDVMRSAVSRMRFPAIVVVGVLLAACGQTTNVQRSAVNEVREPTQAMALPPPGGPAVISVIERRYSNAVQQDIILSTSAATPGHNTLRIQIFGSVGEDGGDTALVERHLSNSEVAREMRELLPGVPMRRSDLYAQNSYGPFGYAIGRSSANDLCIFAWQRIRATRSDATFINRGAIQVRLRLCEAKVSEQDLLAVMYGYTINASIGGISWNPYGVVPPADPRLGNTGQPIHPLTASGPAMITSTVPVEEAPRPAVRPRPRAAAEPAPAAPAVVRQPLPDNAPIVPPPPSAGFLPAPAAGPAPIVPLPPAEAN